MSTEAVTAKPSVRRRLLDALLPRSTFGQTALLMAIALLIGQAVSFFLIVNERQRASLIEASGPAVARFVEVAKELAKAPAGERPVRMRNYRNFDQMFALAPTSWVSERRLPRDAALEQRLQRAMERAEISVTAVEGSNHAVRGGLGRFGIFEQRPRRRGDGGSIAPPNSAAPPENSGPDAAANPPNDGPRARFDPDGPPPDRDAMRAFRMGDGPPNPGGGAPPNGTTIFMTGPGAGPGGAVGPGFGRSPDGGPRFQEIMLAARLPDGQWLNALYRSPRPSPEFLWRLGGAAVALYVIVLGAALFIGSRLARPFRALTLASERLGVEERPAPITPKGPQDVRAAIDAFNAMALRVTGLLEEKDRMLGALGHDLRTPLASLRIRVESMEPESERQRTIETLDDMARTLEDILEIARLGRSTEPARKVDLSALADSVVEEFRDLGKDVSFLESDRAPLTCRRALVARLLRNLIENAVKFGERARVQVISDGNGINMIVEDDGPGIPESELARVRQPFVRLEGSRSRETGGAGLGLSIANSIAAGQGATLTLQNLPVRGLRASVRWPRERAPAPQGGEEV